MTFCVHCGPNVKIDDDGTCSSCGSDAYGKGIEYIERLRAELDDATKWNHSVRVCKDHTADIVDGECVICELAEKIEHIEELEQALAKASLRTQELEEVARAVTLMVGHSVNAHYAKVTGG